MANPYKKAEQIRKVAPGSRPAETKPAETAPVEAKPEKVDFVPEKVEITPEIKEEKVPQPIVEAAEEKAPVEKAPAEQEEADDIFAGMIEQKARGKSYGFYLDDEVVAALEKLAKQKKISKSKVLNTILRNVLIKQN